METFSIERELEVAAGEPLLGRLAAFGLPIAAVPQLDRAATIFALGNCAFKVAIIERMILDFHRQPLVVGIERWSLGYGPRLEHAVQFQTKVVMQPGRVVLLDHESPMFGRADLVFTARLCGLGEIPFRLILGEVALTGHELPHGQETNSRELVTPTLERGFWSSDSDNGRDCLRRQRSTAELPDRGTNWFIKTGHAPLVARVRPERRTGALAGGVGIHLSCGTGFQKVRWRWQTEGLPLLVKSPDSVQAIVDPEDAAKSAGLRYVSDTRPGVRRKKAGKGFTYTRADGSKLTDSEVQKRIKALAIPPAWTDVWICPFADGHIQATGRDAKGRKQYRYHARFREMRESTNYEHVVAFADALPGIREKVAEHMALRGLPREKVLATVVHLLETTLIRVGNDDYAKHNNSYGLTTLKNRHVAIDGNEVRFRFTGKSGKQWSLRVRDRRVAKIIRACQELPGQELIQFFDEEGKCRDVTSAT